MVYGSDKQETYRKYLQRKIDNYKEQILDVLSKIKKLDENIVKQCIDTFGDHTYIEEIEECMYGNSYFVCKYCGFEQ